jgi:dynamin 1-like protein
LTQKVYNIFYYSSIDLIYIDLGKRTIGIITKIDLMDAGTNALDILTGRVLNLKLGFIGVINRSQQDTIAKKPIKESLEAELEFFRAHPAYRNISQRCGTGHLSKTLNQVLVNHIRDRLPDMKSKLNTLIGQTQQELQYYGDPSIESPQNQGLLVLRLLTDFARNFNSSIEGSSPQNGIQLCGGAKIYDIFNSIFGSALKSINPNKNLTYQDIRTAIRNSTGPRPSLFVPEMAFELLIKPQVKLLEQPSIRCVELVYEELMKIGHTCSNKELLKYPKLNAKINEVVSNLLRERLTPTTNYVESLIDIQLAYVNTIHPDFIGAKGALQTLHTQPSHPKEQEQPAKSAAIPKEKVASSETHQQEEDDEQLLDNFFGNPTEGSQIDQVILSDSPVL